MLRELRNGLPVTVERWAHRLGWSRHRLGTASREYLGEPPGDIVVSWKHLILNHLRREGLTYDECAMALGYSGRTNLYRAHRSWKKRFARTANECPPSCGEPDPD